jgi:undecaprenyl diphosphate synthase
MPAKKITLPRGTIVPKHIAVILDGNGRWARSRGLQVTQGHEAGAQAIHDVGVAARNFGVHTVTIWGWSTENWKRPPAEVKKIMALVKHWIEKELDTAHKEKVRFVHLGRKDRLPQPLLKLIEKAENETKQYNKHVLNLAFDYGGRDEILRAMARAEAAGEDLSSITEKEFGKYLDTGEQKYPNPDLFIRTSGELRTSGYLPWQMTYTEFYFEEDHLPDMTPQKLRDIILDYSRRRRRFGAKDKVKHFKFKPELTAKLEVNWWRLANIPEDKTFVEYARQHLSEQWGVSKELGKRLAVLMARSLKESKKENWKQVAKTTKEFYRLIKEEAKLAFEPSLVASMDVKILQRINGGSKTISESEMENDTQKLLSELYRISNFQAKKAARLRTKATVERNLALSGAGEEHWQLAEQYLADYYKALKDRVA